MEFGTPQFWVPAVESIINILLSVDNAVVIALERSPLLVPAAGVLFVIGSAKYLKQRRTAAREHVPGPRRHVTARH